VHHITQINSIYVFCKNESQHKQSAQLWPKVKGIFTAISPICQALKQDVQKCDQDSISISFVSTGCGESNRNLDQLDPTFMYTQILKEILLTISFNEQHIKDFTTYYRENFADNAGQLNNIDKFERDYDNHISIWWYTHECCLYSVLNRALRMMEVDTIIKMGFFIRDLHHQIAQLHSKQFSKHHQVEPFIIFRGQGLSKTDFEKMQKTQGGLISFNNFLSTSKDPIVAHGFARGSLDNPASVGIVFVMTIDPLIKSTPFACINDVSYYKTEDEILFSMHTVFRIGNMIQINNDNRLWQIDLIQTTDNDPQLNDLTKRICGEIQGSTEWDRLGRLLIKLSQFNKAEELYAVLLDQTYNDHKKTHYYHQLGWCMKKQKKYKEAITFYEKSLEIKQKVLHSNHPSFVSSFNEIGSVYQQMNEHSKALLYYEKGLEIQLETQPSDQSHLASSYNKIGSVYKKMNEHSKALAFHEGAVEIRQTLSSDNCTLAYSHNNIAAVYEKIGDYSKALSSHEKALEIQQKILPLNHPDLAQSYSSIGFVYDKMRQYSKALQSHQRAVDIGQRSLPANHPNLQKWQKNLEYAKRKCN
jgi:tetratricopeptide (TPR) repeat protein